MEMKVQPPCPPASAPTPSRLSMHKDSLGIPKYKPKIRIIHLFAPEIIETDAANFRDLVQKLTGKPAPDCGRSTRKRRSIQRRGLKTLVHQESSKTIRLPEELPCLIKGERVKQEQEEVGGGDQNSNGFIDLDDFMRELSQFPILPFESSKMDVFQQMPLV